MIEPLIHVEVTEEEILPEELLKKIRLPQNGAEVAFWGRVRNFNVGRKVFAVSYDIFEPLAKTIFRELCLSVQRQWGSGLSCAVIHRRGRLSVGEISVAIGVGSVHRDEAYRASRFLIEEIKHKAPIWKKEHFEGGESEWVQGHSLCQ